MPIAFDPRVIPTGRDRAACWNQLRRRHWRLVRCQLATQDDKHTMKKTTLYLGLDVHKDSVAIAIAGGGRGGEVRFYGTISNDLHANRDGAR